MSSERPPNPNEQRPSPNAKYEAKETSPGYWVFTPRNDGESLPILKQPEGGLDSFVNNLVRRHPGARLVRETMIKGKDKAETESLEEEASLPRNVRLIKIELDDRTPTIGAALDDLLERGYKLCGDRWWDRFDMMARSPGYPHDEDNMALNFMNQRLSMSNIGTCVVSASAWEVEQQPDPEKSDEPGEKKKIAVGFHSQFPLGGSGRKLRAYVDLDGNLENNDHLTDVYVACIDPNQDKGRFQRDY